MADTTFVDGDIAQSNRIVAAWLNDVNNLRYGSSNVARGAALLQFMAGTGLTVRTAQAKMQEIKSPEDYGAVGDGVTDDTTAMNAALAASKMVRGTPGATYLLSSFMIPQSKQWIDMRGCNVKLKNASNTHLFRMPNAVDDVTVEGGDWDGNKANQTTGGHGFTNAGGAANLRVRLINVTVHDCYNSGIGWAGTTSKYIVEIGIIAYNNGDSGVGTVNGIKQSVVVGSIGYSNGTSNFNCDVSEYIAFAGCVGESPGTADNFTGYGAGTKFIVGSGLIGKGGSNNGMHVAGDYCAFAAIALDSPTNHGFVSRVAAGATVANGLAIAAITVKDAGDSSFWLDNNDGFALAAIVGVSPTDHNVLLDTTNTNGHVSGAFREAGQSNVRVSIATDVVIHALGVDAAVGGGAVLTNTTGAIVSGRFTGNATAFSETGTSNTNLYTGLNATGNTSDTPSFVGAASQVDTSITGGTSGVTAAATITIPRNKNYIVLGGGTAVDTITAWPAQDGPVIIRSDGNNSLTEAGNLKLVSNPVNLTDLDCIILVPDGTNWYQAAPISAN